MEFVEALQTQRGLTRAVITVRDDSRSSSYSEPLLTQLRPLSRGGTSSLPSWPALPALEAYVVK